MILVIPHSLEPLPDGTQLHRADLAVDCSSNDYNAAFATAVVMIVVYPLGIPLSYAAILLRFRHRIHPPHTDRLVALQQRSADLDLKPISFLFSCYSPECFYFELFDSYRRSASTRPFPCRRAPLLSRVFGPPQLLCRACSRSRR